MEMGMKPKIDTNVRLKPPQCLHAKSVMQVANDHSVLYLVAGDSDDELRGIILNATCLGQSEIPASFSFSRDQLPELIGNVAAKGITVIIQSHVGPTPPCPYPPKSELAKSFEKAFEVSRLRLANLLTQRIDHSILRRSPPNERVG